MQKRKKKRPSAWCKGTKKSGLTQVIAQIKSVVIEKCRQWHIVLDDMKRDGESLTLYGHTLGRSATCPCCGKRTTTVHRYSLRKIQCTEWLGHHTTLVLETRHMVCANPECGRKIFAEQSINVDFGDLDLSGNTQFFLWHTWFHDVFSQGGFDIVIGNPPYIDSETMMKSMPEVRELYKMIFGTAKGNWDIYVIFFEHGMKLLNDSGTLSFITPNKWISIGYGKTLRDIFLKKYSLYVIAKK